MTDRVSEGAFKAAWRVLEKQGYQSPSALIGNNLRVLETMHFGHLKLSYSPEELIGKQFAYLSSLGFLDPALQSLAYRIGRAKDFPEIMNADQAEREFELVMEKFGLGKVQAGLEKEVSELLSGSEIRTEHNSRLYIREKDGSRRTLPLYVWHIRDGKNHAGSYAMFGHPSWFKDKVEKAKNLVATSEPGFSAYQVTNELVLAVSKSDKEEEKRIGSALELESKKAGTIVLDFLTLTEPERKPIEHILFSLSRYYKHAERGKLVIGNPTRKIQIIAEEYFKEHLKEYDEDLSKYASFNTLQMPRISGAAGILSSFDELKVNIAEELERLKKNEPSFKIDSVPTESVQGVQEGAKGQSDVLPGAGESPKQ